MGVLGPAGWLDASCPKKEQEPFGNDTPNENPSGLGVFEQPLRFEGTYADRETNLLYNWNRYRDLNSGRFIQADPIGLYGGDLSLYVLTKNNPLSYSDPAGLDVTVTLYPGGTGHIGIGVNSQQTQGLYPQQKSVPVVLCRDVPGVVLNDQTKQPPDAIRRSQSITIKTTAIQDQFIQDYINQTRSSSNATYNLCSQQCTRFVIDALGAGGLGLPRYDSARPQDLFDILRQTYRQ